MLKIRLVLLSFGISSLSYPSIGAETPSDKNVQSGSEKRTIPSDPKIKIPKESLQAWQQSMASFDTKRSVRSQSGFLRLAIERFRSSRDAASSKAVIAHYVSTTRQTLNARRVELSQKEHADIQALLREGEAILEELSARPDQGKR